MADKNMKSRGKTLINAGLMLLLGLFCIVGLIYIFPYAFMSKTPLPEWTYLGDPNLDKTLEWIRVVIFTNPLLSMGMVVGAIVSLCIATNELKRGFRKEIKKQEEE